MFCCGVKTAGQGHGLGNSRIATQLVLAGFPHFPTGNKVGFLEILEIYRDDWLTQNCGVCFLKPFGQLRLRYAFDLEVAKTT